MKSYKSRQGSRKWRKQGHKPWWFYMETYGDKGRTMYQRNGNHNRGKNGGV